MNASPGALGPAPATMWRRYAGAPAGAPLTGLGAGELPPQALRLIRHFSGAMRLRRTPRQEPAGLIGADKAVLSTNLEWLCSEFSCGAQGFSGMLSL
jgi:hypothetical protein